jgi:GH15 family glucan-1,4-alpha-glucosidase
LPCRIEDYGLIGDCETTALVGRDGSIDWLCWPAFDPMPVLPALLGTPAWPLEGRAGGRGDECSRRYWDNTLILETRFEIAMVSSR